MHTIVIATIIISTVLALYGLYTGSKLRFQLRIVSTELSKADLDRSSLLQEKIDNLREIERLKIENKHKDELIYKAKQMKEETLAAAKTTLFELGHNLSKQLIDLHKQENKIAKEESAAQVKSVSDKFNEEFNKILTMVGSLSRDIQESKSSVDKIKSTLLSPSSVGRLAEITLENILKISGLRDKIDYIMQHEVMSADNSKLRPDAVIFLPGGNLMVVDAKASKFLLDDQDPLKLSQTMNLHLRSLTTKEYADNVANSFVRGENFSHVTMIMFLPTEQAVEKLSEADNSFMSKAWAKNIFPVGPSGLMNILSFSKFQINEQARIENHQKIITEIQKLLNATLVMSEHANKLGHNIHSLLNNYDKFASSFNHNFLSKAKNIEKLGLSTAKSKSNNHLKRYYLISASAEEAQEIEEEA